MRALLCTLLLACGSEYEFLGTPNGASVQCAQQRDRIHLCIANNRPYTCIQSRDEEKETFTGPRHYVYACVPHFDVEPEAPPPRAR